MKIVAEFNSVVELRSFIGAFGTTNFIASQIGQGITNIDKVPAVEVNTKKLIENLKEIIPASEIKPIEAPKEKIKEAILAKEAEIANEIEQDQKKDEETKVTKEMIRERLGLIMKAGKQKEVKELVAKHGANKLPDLKEEEYAAVYKEAEELL